MTIGVSYEIWLASKKQTMAWRRMAQQKSGG
jgi:hypothetical protein